MSPLSGYQDKNNRLVIGVDEVGRGALAGPVVAAAVVLPPEEPWFSELRDSKKLSIKKRVYLANKLTDHSVWSIQESPPFKIDEVNILNATLLTMGLAVSDIYKKFDLSPERFIVLVDGNQVIPDLDSEQRTLVNGDNLNYSIAAASILAKVYRDNYMSGIDVIYPEYGFAKHVGYGTAQHREAIMVHGVCPIHRKTFRGVYEYLQN